MVATVTTQVLVDSARHLVTKTHIEGDAAGDITDQLLIDISTFGGSFDDVKIERIQASFLTGMTVTLIWDATANINICFVDDQQLEEVDYRPFGGLINNTGAGKTGDILITTLGLAADINGTLILGMRKRGGSNFLN